MFGLRDVEYHERTVGFRAGIPSAEHQIYDQAKLQRGYTATRFLQMLSEHGGVPTAKRLLASDKYSEGLTRLWEEKRLDISMEATVLQEPRRQLFADGELDMARKRLKEPGYSVDGRSN